MKLTYSDIKSAHFRNIGKAGQYSDTNLLADFQYNLGQRYQMILGTISSYINQQGYAASTVATQQYYSYPVGLVSIDAVSITIGGRQYGLTTIYDQEMWNFWNALQIQPTAIPQFIFPRKSDFGIWPIPQDVYTINFYGFMRDRNLLVDDYTSGSVTVTAGSATVTGLGTTFTTAMVGRWFTITDTSVPGQGFWYKVATWVSATEITLETFWAGSNASGATYRIGECPEIPEETHTLLAAGTASDYYSGLRNDAANALRFDNMFWTGSYNNSNRNIGDDNVQAGLIGLVNKYQSRDRDVIIQRQPKIISPTFKIWSQTIS
jgi:hypothetical protein